MKSFSAEHLKKAVDEGIWATQLHNEARLASAYERAEVVLIFSVNLSRHFQGYARMASKPGRRAEWSEGKKDAWGGAFKIEWIKIYDLPFEQTSHLRNPLNENKEIKISRDGQELPLDVGRALCTMFDVGAAQNPKKRKLESTENLPPPVPRRPTQPFRDQRSDQALTFRDPRYMPPVAYRPVSPPRKPSPPVYASRPRSPPRYGRSPSPPPYRSSSASSRYSPPRSSAYTSSSSSSSSRSSSSRDYDYRFAPPSALSAGYASFMPPSSSSSRRDYSPPRRSPPRRSTPPRSPPRSSSSSSRSSSSRGVSSSSSSGRSSASVAPSLDLLNMTYEDYVASHVSALGQASAYGAALGQASAYEAATSAAYFAPVSAHCV
eukprot:TRINITY_DN1598_c0_g2_i2.p1 TRINITY_DN1598_c0_g2~~TRINITY_DN1598_c0_g2_i2.p1  ORF type:complete len:377 (+),score=91.13 TRINITY_DN1598_c0_g2_i2:888-2018(+)